MNEAPMKNRKNGVHGFATRLKDLREKKGLSQADLSAKAGIHYMHLSRYERGLSRPSADTLKRLADSLEVSGDFLLEGDVGDIATKLLEDRDLLNLFVEIEKFPTEDRATAKKVLRALVNQQKIDGMNSKAS